MQIKKLDAIRGFAAIYVAIGHWTHDNEMVPFYVRQAFRFGQQAVILFFLLSGFVIYIATASARKQSFKEYFIKRFRRIYPIMILSYIFSVIIGIVDGAFWERFNWPNLIGNVFMLQDYATDKPGIWFYYFMGNSPLWSLSYEWWFYMLYFVFYAYLNHKPYRLNVAYGISLVAMISYIVFPNHASLVLGYYIIWFSGYEAAAAYFKDKTFNLQNMWRIIAMNASILILLLGYQFTKTPIHDLLGITEIPVSKPIIHFGTTVLFLSTGLFWWQFRLVGFKYTIGLFTKMAPISYALYMFHFIILVQWDLFKYVNYDYCVQNLILVNVFRVVVLLGLSYLAEMKLQPIVNKYLTTSKSS